MTTGRLAVLALAALLAFGGIGTAFALDGDDDGPGSAQPIELRKDDAAAGVLTEEGDGDPEPTGDGDRTRGNDGTRGGDNSYVAPAAPAGGGYGDSGGGTTG